MRRRDFFFTAPLFVGLSPAAAQQTPTRARIGWLAHGDTMPRHYFDDALTRLGWIERKNLTIERRFSGSAGERVAADAAELVAWHPDVIVAMGTIDARPVADEPAAGTVAFERRASPSFPGLALSYFCECRDASKRSATSGRAAWSD